MFRDILRFLLEITFNLFGLILIARTWLHAVGLNSSNPLFRAISQITDWLIIPIRKIIRAGDVIDWSCLIATWLTAIVYLLSIWISTWTRLVPSSLIGGFIAAAFATIPKWGLNLMVWLVLIQTLFSWLNPMAPIMSLLRMLTEPLLEPIRRLLPSTTIIDFSPLILLILGQVGLMLLTKAIFSLLAI